MQAKNGIIKKIPANFFIVPLLSILFLVVANFTMSLRSDHIFLVSVINICYFLSGFTRRLITGLAIIIVYWIIYDSMKVWPNWAFNDVDIVPLYNLEKALFGINVNGEILIPNEYYLINHTVALDTICAMFYLSWIPLPLLFAFYLYFTNKNLFLRFCMAFFIVNIIGFIIYYIHPAAPPWYFFEHGSVLDVNTKGNAAGLLRFDKHYGVQLFEGIYAKGSNVFAAMPSLHASYPLIGLYYAMKQRRKWISVLFAVVMAGIWFSAVYLSHHYILDVLAGIICGVAGIFVLEKMMMNNNRFRNFMAAYEKRLNLNS